MTHVSLANKLEDLNLYIILGKECHVGVRNMERAKSSL